MKFAVIGNPIDKSLSPQLHNILYEKLNISSCSFEKICLEVDELDNFFNNDNELEINSKVENESSKTDNHDQINNGDVISKQKSIFEKFTDKLKTFLENAE